MYAFLSILAVVLVGCLATPKWHELNGYTFEQYEVDFYKAYPMSERQMRKNIFQTQLRQIIAHNNDETKSWKQGVNRFTDWTPAEMKAINGGIPILEHKNVHPDFLTGARKYDMEALEALDIDWRTKNVISAVKDQGQCGSCWSFGTSETVESYMALATNDLSDLSEQQILDCTPNTNDCGGTGGCGGGTAELAYAKIMQLGGLATEWTYPYVSYFGTNFPCHVGTKTPPFAAISTWYQLPSNEYAPVLAHLASTGPLAINVDASSWSKYETGVFDGCNKTNPDIDHVVQLVGYGTDDTLGPYWLVRNSWSAAWGEQGYIRLKRYTTGDLCGQDLVPSDGTGCNGGPAEVKVCGICGILYDTSYIVARKP